MELHHLRYFISVAQHKSFTKAAQSNHVAQPSLSQQIRRLEAELGAPLFDRGPGPVRLTAVGEALLPHAEAILKRVADATLAVDEIRGLRGGHITVGTLPMTGSRVLPTVVAEFRARFPAVQVLLREESTVALTELVMRGETDVNLTTLPVSQPELDILELLTEDILLAVPPGHRLAGQTQVDLAQVSAEPFMLMKPGYGFRDLCIQACRSAGFEPHVAYESAHIDTIQSLVAVGLGVSLVPRMAAERDRRPAPAFLTVSHPQLTRTLALVWRRERHLSAGARAFLNVAKAIWARDSGTAGIT